MKKKWYVILALLCLSLAGGAAARQQYQTVQEKKELEQKEQEKKQQEAQRKKKEEERKRQIQIRTEAAQKLADRMEEAVTDEALCENMSAALESAEQIQTQIEEFYRDHKSDREEYVREAYEILEKTSQKAEALKGIEEIDKKFSELYESESDLVAMDTAKNDRLFREAQQELWKIPSEYPEKRGQYDEIVERISEEWNYQNDDWHYETSTLKISVEPRETSYTRYWVCHIQTFSTEQICSALCGGTYGNPRRTTSAELADHNGVLGINGSGFSYSTGIPAEGKSMIKDRQVYEDVYSNGNIMCVTGEGGMFTAPAGMTTEEMLGRDVKDTYCFGPTLVENREACEISGQFRQTYRYQRTAVGMAGPAEYYVLVVDGKGAGGSQGMTYEELQEVFLDLGCEYAYNLDGGGSSTLVFKGRVLNSLTDGQERPCADILYFIDVGDGAEGDEIMIHEDEAMIRPPKER